MPSKSKSGNHSGAWGCLAVIAFVVVGCNALFVGNDREPAPVASVPPSTSDIISWTPTPEHVEDIEDLDADGVDDRYDDDKDGDGVIKSRDRDDRDPDKGRRPPKRTPKPKPVAEPKPEPVPLAAAHPGGFCGSPGAVGVASNGRTYTCRDGHWRR